MSWKTVALRANQRAATASPGLAEPFVSSNRSLAALARLSRVLPNAPVNVGPAWPVSVPHSPLLPDAPRRSARECSRAAGPLAFAPVLPDACGALAMGGAGRTGASCEKKVPLE